MKYDVDGGVQLAMSDITSAYLLVSSNTSLTPIKQSAIATTIADISTGVVDFGAVDVGALSDERVEAYPNLRMYPILCSALVPVYRLDAIGTNVKLVLSRSVLAAIFLGEITWWNDTRLQDTNTVVLPSQRIIMILPAPGLARNLPWTTALGKFYAPFHATIPASVNPARPFHMYYPEWQVVSGVTGTSTAVLATDGSISFTFQSVALEMNSQVASLINMAQQIVQANSASVSFAAVELGTNRSPGPLP